MPSLVPKVVKAGDTVRVSVPVLDVDPRKIKVSVSGRTLCVSGSLVENKEERHVGYSMTRTRRGEFEVEVDLPCAVSAQKSEARVRDGVLQISLRRAASDEKTPASFALSLPR